MTHISTFISHFGASAHIFTFVFSILLIKNIFWKPEN
jgi:hypothetical protein